MLAPRSLGAGADARKRDSPCGLVTHAEPDAHRRSTGEPVYDAVAVGQSEGSADLEREPPQGDARLQEVALHVRDFVPPEVVLRIRVADYPYRDLAEQRIGGP